MTSRAHTTSSTPTTTRAGTGRLRLVAFWATILACLPYLTLKLIWISGGEIGIPPGSELLEPDHTTSMRLLNGLTVLMDSAVILLAVVFARDLGRRVPAWLLAGPAWVATGLLAPIVVGYPFSILVELADSSPSAGDGFLEPWIFTMVYGGFLVQALGLGTLFALYADRRWGSVWAGRLPDLEHHGALPALRLGAVAAVVVGLLPLLVRTARALGLVDDLSLREQLTTGMHVPFILAGMAGVLLLAFGRSRPRRLLTVLVLTWAGSAVMVSTSLFVLLTQSTSNPLQDGGPALFDLLVLALTLASGALIVSAGMTQLAIRAESCWPTGDRPRPAPAAGLPRRVA